MKKNILDIAAFGFVSAVTFLSAISILGIWEFFNRDVIEKSFSTLGLLSIVAIVVMAAGHFIGKTNDGQQVEIVINPIFSRLRKTTIKVLITCVSVLAFFGVLAIWEIIPDVNVIYKSVSSLGICIFGAFLIILTCLDREGRFTTSDGKDGLSIKKLVLFLIAGYIVFSFLSSFLYSGFFRSW